MIQNKNGHKSGPFKRPIGAVSWFSPNGKSEYQLSPPIVPLPAHTPTKKVENAGKPQTKRAVGAEHFPVLTCSQMLRKPICISILSSLYVEVTPKVPDREPPPPENARL